MFDLIKKALRSLRKPLVLVLSCTFSNSETGKKDLIGQGDLFGNLTAFLACIQTFSPGLYPQFYINGGGVCKQACRV